VPDPAFNSITNQITISVWVSWDDPETMSNGDGAQLLSIRSGTPILGVRPYWLSGHLDFSDDTETASYPVDEQDWSGVWNHYAFVKDVSEGYLRIYHNGKLVAEAASSRAMNFPSDLARIGAGTSHWTAPYSGLLDDFRVYDYALSQTEIAYIVQGDASIPLYIPVDSQANLYDKEDANSKAVNWKDFCIIADCWLEQAIWPRNG
jgi:hypothetical protein